MSYLPRAGPASTAKWPDLVDELDRWGEAGRVAALWWRDDDAVAPGAALERLLDQAGDIPLSLAAIPQAAEPALADALVGRPGVAVLQHGWRHADHGGDGRKSEFPASRAPAAVADDLAAGRTRLVRLFGTRALPVFVPPWNRFDDRFLPLLAEAGFAAISALDRPRDRPPPGMRRVDVAVDLVAWRAGRGFVGTQAALAGLVAHLRARRLGRLPGSPATGILTHHLVADERSFAFLERLGAVTGGHEAARWVGIGTIIASDLPEGGGGS